MIVVWILVAVVALGAASRYAFADEAHWVAKDGRAFDCRVREIGKDDLAIGRWTDARAFIDGPQLIVRRRAPGRPRGLSAHYTVFARKAEGGHVVFLADGGGVNGHEFAQVRVPSTSRALEHLDALISPSAPDRGTDRAPHPLDPC